MMQHRKTRAWRVLTARTEWSPRFLAELSPNMENTYTVWHARRVPTCIQIPTGKNSAIHVPCALLDVR